jgi:anti-sigma-K factor RskA
MFDMGGDGDHSVVLSGDMDAGDTVGVTVEPAGGSDAPTTAPVIVVPTA